MSKIHKKPSALNREHPALKKCSWVIFALLDPDPDCEAGSRYGSMDTIQSGSGSTALLSTQVYAISFFSTAYSVLRIRIWDPVPF